MARLLLALATGVLAEDLRMERAPTPVSDAA